MTLARLASSTNSPFQTAKSVLSFRRMLVTTHCLFRQEVLGRFVSEKNIVVQLGFLLDRILPVTLRETPLRRSGIQGACQHCSALVPCPPAAQSPLPRDVSTRDGNALAQMAPLTVARAPWATLPKTVKTRYYRPGGPEGFIGFAISARTPFAGAPASPDHGCTPMDFSLDPLSGGLAVPQRFDLLNVLGISASALAYFLPAGAPSA